MENVQILEFNPTYHQQVIDLILTIQTKEFLIPISITEQPELQNIPSFYQTNNSNFWLALLEEQVIGTIALVDIGNNQGALCKMFVAKDYRGKNNGISQKLLDTVCGWCHAKNIKEICL